MKKYPHLPSSYDNQSTQTPQHKGFAFPAKILQRAENFYLQQPISRTPNKECSNFHRSQKTLSNSSNAVEKKNLIGSRVSPELNLILKL